MKARVFLIADKAGGVRLTKRAPWLSRGEVCLQVALTIPDGCFQSPVIPVALDVPADHVEPAVPVLEFEGGMAG